jgi:hypothetical protein
LIRILGVDWIIRQVNPRLAHPSRPVMGLTDFALASIEIDNGLPDGRAKATFFHELMHILVENEDGIDDHAVEGFVSRISASLYGVLEDNDLLSDGWFENLIDEKDTDEVESKRVIVDHDPNPDSTGYVPVRPRDYAETIPASGRNHLERSSE